MIVDPVSSLEIDNDTLALYFDYQKALPCLKNLVGQWSSECIDTAYRRDERYIDIDVDSLRASGELKADETMIPVRVIDTNISREHPAYSAFITQSRRLVTLICSDQPNVDSSRLELEVTRGLRYPGWFKEFYRCADGAMTHGWDAVEVVFDPTKPLHVAFEHIGHDKLYFNQKVKNVQESERVIRKYTVTSTTLKSFVTGFGFAQDQVDLICKTEEQATRTDKVFDIFKAFFKVQSVVYVAWYADKHTNNWLRAPEALRLGISNEVQRPPLLPGMQPVVEWQDTPVDVYPVFILPYKETEQDEITSKVGRSYLDGDWQEAQTAVVSGFVNGLLRASNVYAAPEDGTEEGASIKQLDTELTNGVIFSKALKFFSPPYPDTTTLAALNYLNGAQAAQAGQVDYAAMSRKDSKKTATEIDSAQAEAELLKGTPITLYSEWLRDVFDLAWRIIQSQGMQDKIPLLRTPMQVSPEQPPIYVNDKMTIGMNFLVLPAGDSDVVARKEKIVQMMQDWPVISATPIAMRFLSDLLRLKYPDVGSEYAELLLAGDVGKGLVQGLSESLKQVVGLLPPEVVSPESQQQLQALDVQVQQYLQPKPQTMPTQ